MFKRWCMGLYFGWLVNPFCPSMVLRSLARSCFEANALNWRTESRRTVGLREGSWKKSGQCVVLCVFDHSNDGIGCYGSSFHIRHWKIIIKKQNKIGEKKVENVIWNIFLFFLLNSHHLKIKHENAISFASLVHSCRALSLCLSSTTRQCGILSG
jgi:hypothetical protein